MPNTYVKLIKDNINVVSSLLAFGINIVINIFLSPIVINDLGTEAYGYAQLANNVAYYFTLIGLAVNSVGIRFVTIAWHKGGAQEANEYFCSIFLFDSILAWLIFISGCIVSIRIDYFFHVSAEYVVDAQAAFILAFVSSALSTVLPVLNSGIYISDEINVLYFATILSQIVKLVLSVFLFSIGVRIYYISLAGLAGNLILGIFIFLYNKLKVPELKFHFFSAKKVKLMKVVKSGIWIFWDNVSTVLLSGLNLVYANLLMDASMMGLLSVATAISSQFLSLIQYLVQSFVPSMLAAYSSQDSRDFYFSVQRTQKICAFLIMIPVAGVIVFGKAFFALWLPERTSAEIEIIQRLSIISALPYIILAVTQVFRQIIITYNRVKMPTIMAVGIGIAEMGIILVFGKCGMLTVSILSAISALALLVKEIAANFLFAIYISGFSLAEQIKNLKKNLIIFVGIAVLYSVVEQHITINGWGDFIMLILLCGTAGYGVTAIYMRLVLGNSMNEHEG